jgi:hypothetical protein
MTYRTLTISTPETYEQLYAGFIIGQQKNRESVPREVVRLEASIHEAFRAIGKPVNEKDHLSGYTLNGGPGVLRLTTAQYELVDKALDKVPWAPSSSVQIAALFDLWGSAERETQE